MRAFVIGCNRISRRYRARALTITSRATTTTASPATNTKSAVQGGSAVVKDSSVAWTAELLDLRSTILKRVPIGAVTQVQTLYGSLTADQRRLMRKGGFASLLAMLRHCATMDEPSVAISKDGLRVTLNRGGGRALDAATEALLNPITPDPPPAPSVSGMHNNRRLPSHQADVTQLSENLWEVFQASHENFVPPPPPRNTLEMSRADRKLHEKIGVGHAGVFSAEMMVPFIPTFFVPIEDILIHLPAGYTAEHIEGVFSGTRTLDIVRLEGKTFVRMHGGSSTDLSHSPEANAKYAQYEPDPTLTDCLLPLFERPFKWYPLRQIVTSLSPQVEQRLPFHRYKSLLYFAQMQHRFGFAPDGEGEVCAVTDVDSLGPHNSPTPVVLFEITRLLTEHHSVSPSEILDSLSQPSLAQLVLYYQSLEEFLSMHRGLFEWCETRRVVELHTVAEARKRANLTLEEKLELALMSGEKRDVRKLRRRIATLRNPNNPLLDREKLIEEVKKFLPKTRNISFRALLRNMPPDIVDLLPADQIGLFRTSPQHFQVFEFRQPGRLHIMRAGLPLPPGHLRLNYTEEELLHLCAMHLLYHPRLMVDVFSRLPWAAREIVRIKYKGLFHLLAMFPQYFTIVFKDGKQKYDSRGATVCMVAQPPMTASVDAILALQQQQAGVLAEDVDEEAVVAEVQRNASSLGYTPRTENSRREDDASGEETEDAEDGEEC